MVCRASGWGAIREASGSAVETELEELVEPFLWRSVHESSVCVDGFTSDTEKVAQKKSYTNMGFLMFGPFRSSDIGERTSVGK